MKAIVAKASSIAVVCMLSSGARADAPLSKKPGHDATDTVKWTLHVGDKTYGMRPEGGSIPLPAELDWSCRYSQPRAKSNKDSGEVLVHVTCTRSDSRFAFTPVCARGGHGEGTVGSAPSSAAQSVTLYTGNQIVVVGVSCDVP